MQLLQCGLLAEIDLKHGTSQGDITSHAMPSTWTKAIIAVRVNQCVRGHSAISQKTIQNMLHLLAAGITPIIPLRGSISASGDLMPLAYIAGLLEGSPDIFATRSDENLKTSHVMTASDALIEAGLKPLELGPREALGLVNGTAASAAAASLAVADAVQLTLLTAGITCLVSEAMAARVEWLHPFIAETRPHPGQIEAAAIMRTLLDGSQLVSGLDSVGKTSLPTRPRGGLMQDRYPLRTSPQWLGPQFEDLQAAYSQISIELNSTTDNPLTNPETGSMHHGGNFQATSITSAVEKIRLSLQMAGKLLFSQCTEMMNHHMNAGLPPNLAADDPSASFCCKGLDISIAAYQSELSYLANTMSNHVQSAEMHNQAVNSIALIATRYTIQAAELLGLIVAGVLYAACQAIDLRVMHSTFLHAVSDTLRDAKTRLLVSNPMRTCKSDKAFESAFGAFCDTWWARSASDAPERCLFSSTEFVKAFIEDPTPGHEECLDLSARQIGEIQKTVQREVLQVYLAHRVSFIQQPTTLSYIGAGTNVLYRLVREELGIPMHRGLEDHPVPGGPPGQKTIGSHVSIIVEAVKSGKLFSGFVRACEATGPKGKDVDVDIGVNGAAKEPNGIHVNGHW